MRICMMLSTPLPPREGIGFYVWNLARQLRDQGHTLHLVTRRGRGQQPQEVVEGITIWRPPFLPLYPFHVHYHGLYVARLVQHLQSSVDLFHLHTPLVSPIVTDKPLMVTVHTPLKSDIGAIPPNNALAWLTKLQGPVSYRLEQQLLDRADSIAAVATSVAQELSDYGIDPAHVRVLGNGVNTDLFTPGPDGPDRAQPYFLTTGRLGLRKGLEDLVQCAAQVVAQFPDHRFLIVGAGPLEGDLRAEIARLRLEHNVILPGHITDRQEMAKLYQGATAYVSAAHYEGLSTALLEAMAAGRPVVATAVSGALDVVQPERNGLLVPPRTPQAMAEALTRLIRTPALADQYGQAARRTIEECYSWQVVGQGYLDEYMKLVHGSAS